MGKNGLTHKDFTKSITFLVAANVYYEKHENNCDDKLLYSNKLKYVTNNFKLAIKSKDVDGVLRLEAICQNMDSKLMASINNPTGVEQQDRVEDILRTITKLWKDAKDPELVKEMYAKDIEKGNLNKLVIGGISPSVKSYRTVLRNIPGQLANTTQKNYYFKRMEAMDLVRKEYNMKIEKTLGIEKAPKKGIER